MSADQAKILIEEEIEKHMDTLSHLRMRFLKLSNSGQQSMKRKIIIDIAEHEGSKQRLLTLRDNLVLRGEL